MFFRSIVLTLLPIIVLLAGGLLMAEISGRDAQRKEVESTFEPNGKKTRPLNLRFFGYSAADAHTYWAPLARNKMPERRFLQIDLAFPLVYGIAWATSLFLAGAALGVPLRSLWPWLLLIALLADWSENLIQLKEFGAYDGTVESLSEAWIIGASVATMAKLWILTCLWLAVPISQIHSLRRP